MEKLQEEYDAWLKANVPAHWLEDGAGYDLSAENLMTCVGYYLVDGADEDVPDWSPSNAQYAWLADFCKRWTKEEQT